MPFKRSETLSWLFGRAVSLRDQLHHSARSGYSYCQLDVGRVPTAPTVGLFLILRNVAHDTAIRAWARRSRLYGPIYTDASGVHIHYQWV